MTTMTKVEIRENLEVLVREYNEAIQDGKFDESTKLDGQIQELVGEYTAIAVKECFDALKQTDDPMLAAIKQLTYPSIRAKDSKIGEEKIPVRTIEDVDKPIDILRLHKYVGRNGIGADKNWNYMIEKFNFLLTAQKCIDLGIDPKDVNDSYAMHDISRAIDMGKTPCSKTNILKTLNSVIHAMIGDEYKGTSHDVNFLLSVYSKKSKKALTVTCANHRYLRQYMMEICHRIVMNKSYAVEFKVKKN